MSSVAPLRLDPPPRGEDPWARRILENFGEFDRRVHEAEALLAAGDLRSAAAYATMAAGVAVETHCGLFASARIERLLTTIGKRTETETEVRPMPGTVRRVLHVASQVFPIGGHSKMIRLWVENDTGRRHSLALTQQGGDVPPEIRATFEQQGGRVHHRLNRLPGDALATANALRRLARDHDLVVLHTGNNDPTPSIAFAQTDRHPPVLFVNHTDHVFWLGSAISQVVAGMRAAAMRLAVERRGVRASRSLLLPILVAPTIRMRTREEARKALGVAQDELLLISLARPEKYRTYQGASFADLHVEVLRRFPKARLMLLGAGERPDWEAARRSVGGRIEPLSARDPRPYLEAADIYLDSYPFCSATSMMEAAGFGLPCVTRASPPQEAGICGMDHPGLSGPLIETDDDGDYSARIAELIESPELRRRRGDAMLASVAAWNTPPAWLRHMEAAYAAALSLPRPDGHEVFPSSASERPMLGEPDIRIEDIYGRRRPADHMLMEHLSRMSFRRRLQDWGAVHRAGMFGSPQEAVRCLLPEWMVRLLKDGP